MLVASAEAMAAAKEAQSNMYSALLARRQMLMAEFEMKAAKYKEILVKEMVRLGREGTRSLGGGASWWEAEFVMLVE